MAEKARAIRRDTFRNFPPVILGREFVGSVVAEGADVQGPTDPTARYAVLGATAVTLKLLAQGLRPSRIVTHRLPLAPWREAFALSERKEAAKVLLLPGSP